MSQLTIMSRPALSLRAKGFIIVLIPLVTMVAGLMFLRRAAESDRSTRLAVRRAYETRAALRQVLADLVDAETGVRGYLLTRREPFLEPYRAARRVLPGHIQKLQSNVRGDEAQQARLRDQVLPVAQRRTRLLEETLQKFAASGDAAQIQPLLIEGKAEMDALRREIEAMRQVEVRRLERLGEEDGTLRSLLLYIALPMLGLGGGFLATLLFTSDIARRIRHLRRNAGLLASEQPLLSATPRADELGDLERELEAASTLMAQRQQALRESEQRFRQLAETVHDVFWLSSLESGQLLYVSPAYVSIWGREPDDLYRDPRLWLASVHPDDQARVAAAYEVRRATKRFDEEYRVLRPDGEVRWVSDRAFPIRDASGKVYRMAGVAEDITTRKVAEASVLAAKEEAERANMAKSEFLSRMSHELRTPLNAILGFGQLLEMSDLEPYDAEGANQIVRAGRHLLGLINEVLDIARIESGNLAFSPEPVSVSEVAIETLDLVRPLARERGIRLDEAALRECACYIRADRQRLKQVLLNLLSNAIKYNRDNGVVALSWSEDKSEGAEEAPGGRLSLCVRDTGPGIAPEKMNRLFIPFDRLGAENSGVEGAGIGLALSRRLVEAMGGQLSAQSTWGEGSAFCVELPLAQSPLQTMQPHAEDEDEDEQVTTTRWVVLYIEDNLSNLQLLQRVLARRPEIKLLSAMQGSLGLELARQHHPHLILLDLHLPEMSGEEVLRRLQGDPQTSGTPVVILSADATPGQVERLLKSGASAYLSKPFNIREFMGTLNANLPSEPTTQSATKTSV